MSLTTPFMDAKMTREAPSRWRLEFIRVLTTLRWRPRQTFSLESEPGQPVYSITYDIVTAYWSGSRSNWILYGFPVAAKRGNDNLITPGWSWKRPAADHIICFSANEAIIEFNDANNWQN